MDHRWTKGLVGEDKDKRIAQLKKNKAFCDDVIEILESMLDDTAPDYEKPNWAFVQADRNGANRKVREVIKLLKLD